MFWRLDTELQQLSLQLADLLLLLHQIVRTELQLLLLLPDLLVQQGDRKLQRADVVLLLLRLDVWLRVAHLVQDRGALVHRVLEILEHNPLVVLVVLLKLQIRNRSVIDLQELLGALGSKSYAQLAQRVDVHETLVLHFTMARVQLLFVVVQLLQVVNLLLLQKSIENLPAGREAIVAVEEQFHRNVHRIEGRRIFGDLIDDPFLDIEKGVDNDRQEEIHQDEESKNAVGEQIDGIHNGGEKW